MLDALADTPSIPIPPIPPGTYLADRLRVLDVLGVGGMGVVYRARDEALERDVAVKLVDPERVSDATIRARFLEEARAMARVRHPSVVEIYNFGEHRGAPYFVMEYVAGTTLDAWLRAREEPALALHEAIPLLEGIATALEAIHATGTVHGDLKPANVLLTSDGRVRLADFGLATDLTSDLELIGTPAYLSPERIRGDAVDPALRPRGDLYAFGVLTHQLLTGELPFDAPDVARVYAQHLHKVPPSLTRRLPEVDLRIDAELQRLLAKDPAERAASARELLRVMRLADPTIPHVLVVDDDPDFRVLARACIEEELEPCVVVESDGSDVMSLLSARRFELVVLDLHMPNTSGVELTKAIRARHPRTDLRILVVTGQGSARDWLELKQLGADAFTVKPLEPVTFTSAARRLIEAA